MPEQPGINIRCQLGLLGYANVNGNGRKPGFGVHQLGKARDHVGGHRDSYLRLIEGTGVNDHCRVEWLTVAHHGCSDVIESEASGGDSGKLDWTTCQIARNLFRSI